jgi:transposase
MLRPGEDVDVYLYAGPVAMRKSINGLSIIVEQSMVLPTNSGGLFVFCNGGRDKIKILCWERAMALLSGTSDLSDSGSAGQRFKTP